MMMFDISKEIKVVINVGNYYKATYIILMPRLFYI